MRIHIQIHTQIFRVWMRIWMTNESRIGILMLIIYLIMCGVHTLSIYLIMCGMHKKYGHNYSQLEHSNDSIAKITRQFLCNMVGYVSK